jgi:hypothetical protein
LQYARPQMLAFMFRHGHYAEACSLFFPFNQPTTEGETSLSSVPWSDPLTTDYGTIDDLCDLCLGYGAMAVLENTIRAVTQSPAYHETPVIQYMNTVLTRICNYCETHRHFNYLYNFLVLSISIWITPLDSTNFITSRQLIVTMEHDVSGSKRWPCCFWPLLYPIIYEFDVSGGGFEAFGTCQGILTSYVHDFTIVMHYLEFLHDGTANHVCFWLVFWRTTFI